MWLAVLVLVIVSVVIAKSQGKRTGGPMLVSFFAGLLLAFLVSSWWGSGPLAEQVPPTPAPTEAVSPSPTGDQVPAPTGPVG